MNAVDTELLRKPARTAWNRAARQAARPPVPSILRATVLEIDVSGDPIVSISGRGKTFACDVLLAGASYSIKPGDKVLVLRPSSAEPRGVVLGLIQRYAPPSPTQGTVVERLEVSATEFIALKCGEAALELRKDGKLLIRGQDVVSHAKRANRIKGGAVTIN